MDASGRGTMLRCGPGMQVLRSIKEIAERQVLPFLLIGGHAVNIHGYSRMTEDIDLLIRREDLAAWREGLAKIGYTRWEEHGAFCQMNSSNAGSSQIDLMLVNNTTFEKLHTRAGVASYIGSEIPVVAVEHLIALKLHALRQELPHRAIKDFLDVVELIRANRLDLQSAEMQEIFKRYATEDLARKIKIACE